MQRITIISPARLDQAVNVEIVTPFLMKLGESAKLRIVISLEMLDSTAEEGKDVLKIQSAGLGKIGRTVYHSQVRFILARLPVIPNGELIGTFNDRTPGVFLWQINVEEIGEYLGRIWLFAQPLPIMLHSEDLLLSKPISMQYIKF